MRTTNAINLLFGTLLLAGTTAIAQTNSADQGTKANTAAMKTFLIERVIPDAGKLTAEQLRSISQKSCSILKEMGPRIEWINSYVTGNKVYCIYKSESEELIREHAKKGGFPANTIVEVATQISPATAN